MPDTTEEHALKQRLYAAGWTDVGLAGYWEHDVWGGAHIRSYALLLTEHLRLPPDDHLAALRSRRGGRLQLSIDNWIRRHGVYQTTHRGEEVYLLDGVWWGLAPALTRLPRRILPTDPILLTIHEE